MIFQRGCMANFSLQKNIKFKATKSYKRHLPLLRYILNLYF